MDHIFSGENMKINFYDSKGTLVHSEFIHDPNIDQLKLDISDWAQGIYFISIINQGVLINKRFQILH